MTPDRPLKIAALILAAPVALPLAAVALLFYGLAVWYRVVAAIVTPAPADEREPISPPSR